MAKFNEIRSGKKFYQARTTNERNCKTGKRNLVLLTFYVISKHEETKMVLASVNKGPARWFNLMNYRNWTIENPFEK